MKENLDITIDDYFQKVEELKNDGYEMMVDLTAIDWFRKKEPRFYRHDRNVHRSWYDSKVRCSIYR